MKNAIQCIMIVMNFEKLRITFTFKAIWAAARDLHLPFVHWPLPKRGNGVGVYVMSAQHKGVGRVEWCGKCRNTCRPQLCSSSRTPLVCRQALFIPEVLSCSDFRVHAVEPRKCTVSAGSYGAEASTAPAALMDCWTFMCTVCNVCRSDGGDQLVKVN